MLRGLWVLIPGLLLTGPACGSGGTGGALPAVSPAEVPVRVEVTNNYALPVEIYALGSGINHRLGTVHPGMSGRFTLPPTMVGSGTVEFEARSSSSAPYRSGQLMLAPGRVVELVVAAQMFNSTAILKP